MYSDNLFGETWYLVPQTMADDESITYESARETFLDMKYLCRDLFSDIGHLDMLIQFDDIEKFEKAKAILANTNLMWKER